LRLADAQFPDLRLAALAVAMRDRVADFAKGKGDEARRAAVAAQLQPAIDGFVTAATALDARADAAVQAGDAPGAARTYAQLRAAEDAFFQPNATTWSRTLLYNVDGYNSSVLPSLDATLGSGGDAAVATLNAAIIAGTAAAAPPSNP
jgi:hypothetical protein